jgi:hypothetical protein
MNKRSDSNIYKSCFIYKSIVGLFDHNTEDCRHFRKTAGDADQLEAVF